MKIVSATNFFASTASNTTAASLTSLGEHATDDDIFICVGHDGSGTGAITMTTGTGWTEVVTQAASDDVRSTVFRKRVTSPETVPVFSANGATSEEWSGTVFVVRGLNATTPVSHWHRVDVSNTNSWNSNGGVAGSTLAAGDAGATAATFTDGQILVLHAHADAPQPLSPDIGVLTEIDKSVSATSTSHIVGFKTLNGTGTVPNVVIRGNAAGATEGGVCYALVLNPATSSDTLGCATADVSVVAYLGDIGAIHDQAITWGAANSRDATNGGTILGVVTGSTAITPTTSTGPENTSSPWGAFTTWSTNANLGTAAWTGGIGTLTSTVNISGKMLAFQMSTSYIANAPPTGEGGLGVYLEDNASHWSFFRLRKSNTMPSSYTLFTPMFDPSTALRSAGSGTLDLTNLKYIGFMAHRGAGSGSARTFSVKSILAVGKTTFIGGGTTDPTTWDAAVRCLTSWGMVGPAVRHVASTDQFQIKQNADIGDGTNAVVFSSTATSMAFPSGWDGTLASLSDYKATVGPGGKNITLVGGTGSALVLDGSLMSADSDTAVEFTVSASYAGTVSVSGCTLSGYTFTDSKGLSWDGLTIQKGGTATIAEGGDLTNCTISQTTSTNAALAITGNGSVLTGCTVTVGDVAAVATDYHMELGSAVTAVTLTDHTFTGTSDTTDKVRVKFPNTTVAAAADALLDDNYYKIKTPGDTDWVSLGAANNSAGTKFKKTGTSSGTGDAYQGVTITISGTTTLADGDISIEATETPVSIAAPAYQRGQNFTGLIAGSQVKVFTTGTDTELFSDNNSATTETWDDATSGSVTVDYVVQKAGYLPIRVTGVVVTGAVGTGIQTVQISQVLARWYQASSGLTINTNTFANAGTKLFGLTVASTLQNFASYMLEQWIALGDTGEAYANKEFPIEANGPNSFTFRLGWEWDLTTYPNSISNSSRDGLRYMSAAGAVTASWAAILTSGALAGSQVRYQQSDAGTTVNAENTGEMDQLVQIYGDATHGNFDKTGYLVLKVQREGYDQAEANVVTLYGTLEDQLYVVGLTPTANGIATGDPALTITISQGTYTEDGKTFSVKIVDNVTPSSGTDILRELRYNFAAGGAYQGEDAFNWHDLVRVNGSSFKTVNGTVYGTAATKGVLVYENDGVTLHPDFTLFTSDAGTTYSPPLSITIANANLVQHSTVLLRRDRASVITELDIQVDIAAGGYSFGALYGPGQTIQSGDIITIYATYAYGTAYKENYTESAVASESGITFLGEQVDWTHANSLATDGSLQTEYSADYPNVEMNITSPDATFKVAELIAWGLYNQTLADGIRNYYGCLRSSNAGNWELDVDIVDLWLDNTQPFSIKQSDNVILMRSDQAYPQANVTSGGGGIGMIQSGLVFTVAVGSAVLPQDVTDIKNAVISAAVDGTVTMAESMRLRNSMLAGKVSGAGTNTETFRSLADDKDRAVITTDQDGNRTDVVLDLT